jgi:hypothetical protein
MLDRVRRNRNGRYSGVNICDEWNSFENFLNDMGERPEGTTIDRIDSAGDYEPSNCRWATVVEQARNRKNQRLTFESAVEVAKRRLLGEKCKSIANDFGISENLPREIVKGRTWKDALHQAEKEVRRLLTEGR